MVCAYRSVVFNGELRDENGMEIISRLVLLAAEDPHSDIHLWVNSPGGSVPMMHAIADMIETLPNGVVTVAFGWAASAGQFVLMMGTPGSRLALPHARILLHRGSSGIGGVAADIKVQSGTCATFGTRFCIASPTHRPICAAESGRHEPVHDSECR